MVAFLLCAGFGTRMQPLTATTPKSLLQVGNQPILDYLMEDLQEWTRLTAIHVVTNHSHAEAFERWAENWESAVRANGVDLHVHDDGVEGPDDQLGAVGDLQFLLEKTGIPTEGALVCGGDSLYRFPLSPVMNAFDGTTSRLLALHEPDPAQRRQSSCLQLDGSHVTGLNESPNETNTERICPSWYLLTAEALSSVEGYLADGGDPDTLGRFIDALTGQMPLEALRLPANVRLRFHCNTPADLRAARTQVDAEGRLLLDKPQVRARLRSAGMGTASSSDA